MRQLQSGALSTRVGRRTLLLFVACALLPTFLFAALSYTHVRDTLRDDAARELGESAKRRAVQIVERANWLSHLIRDRADGATARSGSTDIDNGPKLRRVIFVETADATDGKVSLQQPDGEQLAPPPLDARNLERVKSGGVTIVVQGGPSPRVWFVAAATDGTRRGIVWAEPDPRFLWGFEASESLTPELCVAEGRTGIILRCTAGGSPAVAQTMMRGGTDAAWLTSTRTVFLGSEFGAGDWRVISMQPVRTALLPFEGFARTLLLVTALSLLVVFFVSQVQIRRQTEPLALLHTATREVANGNFDVTLATTSDDEVGALAESFVSMSSSLGRQVKLWRAMDDVDRRALEATDLTALISSAASTLTTAGACRRAVVALRAAAGSAWDLVDLDTTSDIATTARRIDAGDAPPVLRAADTGHDGPDVRRTLTALGIDPGHLGPWILFPLWHREEYQGTVLLGFDRSSVPTTATRRELRQLADRLAVALANVRLVRRLDALSLGTITAFARAIDANSSWTAGHSERVTQLALLLGDALQLSEPERETLQRGALLHDIGKLGVPATILDKPAPLTDVERQIVQAHPTLGVTILQPIGAFSDILPIVRSHHERFDGLGYPDGLSGTGIPYLARVLSVADVFDALVSDRPYRAGMSANAAVDLIRQDMGRAFDPRVTQVFVALHESGAVDALRSVDAHATALAEVVGHSRLILQENA
ncbi:MAG: HD domain-containing protein [Gemmatimonadaceae bacterium]